MKFCAKHPIRWGNRELANGPGNILTPTPALGLFFQLLQIDSQLFTQHKYQQFAWDEWKAWIETLQPEQRQGIAHRLYRNFYPSAIDSLHVWALLVETGEFDKCALDTMDDAIGKTDISVYPVLQGKPIKVALYAGSHYSRNWTKYKREYRSDVTDDMIDIVLPMDRPKTPGNKRWYNLDDLQPIIVKAQGYREPSLEPVQAHFL